MNDAQLIDRANKAKAILENPAYREAFEAVRLAIHQQIEEAPIRDQEGVHQLRLCLKLLRDVRVNLETALNQGKLASFKLAQEEKRRNNPLANFFR